MQNTAQQHFCANIYCATTKQKCATTKVRKQFFVRKYFCAKKNAGWNYIYACSFSAHLVLATPRYVFSAGGLRRPMPSRFSLDLRWIYIGFTSDLPWIYVGFTLDLRRFYIGFTLDSPDTPFYRVFKLKLSDLTHLVCRWSGPTLGETFVIRWLD